jgi:hypothetical protein
VLACSLVQWRQDGPIGPELFDRAVLALEELLLKDLDADGVIVFGWVIPIMATLQEYTCTCTNLCRVIAGYFRQLQCIAYDARLAEVKRALAEDKDGMVRKIAHRFESYGRVSKFLQSSDELVTSSGMLTAARQWQRAWVVASLIGNGGVLDALTTMMTGLVAKSTLVNVG